MELYGEPMLVDGVGTSLIAKAPYANDLNQSNNKSILKSGKAENPKHSMPANARAGSMKQPVDQKQAQKAQVNNAYNEAGISNVTAPGALQQNLNIQNQGIPVVGKHKVATNN